MIKPLLLSLSLLLSSLHSKDFRESHYQKLINQELGGVTEYKLPSGDRVDILTDELAIEVDFCYKMYESIGQAEYYYC